MDVLSRQRRPAGQALPLAQASLAVATSLIDPADPGERGAEAVTVQVSEQTSRHDDGSLAVSTNLPPQRLFFFTLLTN